MDHSVEIQKLQLPLATVDEKINSKKGQRDVDRSISSMSTTSEDMLTILSNHGKLRCNYHIKSQVFVNLN
jgi:hypothetical protein